MSFNTKEMTLKCIESIFAETTKFAFELIIIDNASSDGSAEALKNLYSHKAKVFCLEENLGFAAANNFAAQKAIGDQLLLINPDTEVLNHAIEQLVTFSQKNPESKIWGGRTLFIDRKLNPTSCWHKMTLWSLVCNATGLSFLFNKNSFFNVEGMGGWDRSGTRQVDIVSGCFFLISRKFWTELDGFDKEFFMYGEEADMCLRAAKLGAKPKTTSAATIVHHGGASETVKSDKLVKLLSAKSKLIRKHFSPPTITLGQFLLSMWPLSRLIAHSLLSLFGRNSSKKSVQIWKDVWERKQSWNGPSNDFS